MTMMIGRPGEAGAGGGVQLGKYLLDSPLGAGGMAEVFRAHTQGVEGFRRPVAIKRILPDASRNPAFAEMFVAEAKLSSRLQHPNIVSVLDFDRDHEGRLYLVMELVEGRDLDEVLAPGRLPFSLVVYTITEVLRGLGYAHDLPAGADGVRGLIHRDISPHNVLCAWNGAVKVSDFGIAKARAATAASASIVIKGKPAYMSPEQINGAPLDGRSDLFSVGVMLWQMMTGQHLFALGTTTETLARVLFAPVPSPRAVNPEIPPDLEAITLRLLARDPARRYPTAEDAIDDLLRCHDAPRDGRRELEHLLIARFPHKAPVRTGQRGRSGIPEPPAALAHGTPPPPLPRAGWGTVALRGPTAETRTARGVAAAVDGGRANPAPADPGRRRVRAVAAAIGAAGLAALVITAVMIVARGPRAAGRDDSAAEIVPADAAAVPVSAAPAVLGIDAGPDLPVDAATPLEPRRRRSGGRPASPGAASGAIHEIRLLPPPAPTGATEDGR